MKTLYLTLKKQWFDLINDGIKTEEYREIKPYWQTRLEGKAYDVVEFRNGYQKDASKMTFKIKEIVKASGNAEWGASDGQTYYVIKLGERKN
jgi:hypothetical protein